MLITDLDAGHLIVLDSRARKEVNRVTLGKAVEGILVTPDGAKAYVAESGDDSVAVIDTKTWTVTSRIKAGAGPDGMAWVK